MVTWLFMDQVTRPELQMRVTTEDEEDKVNRNVHLIK